MATEVIQPRLAPQIVAVLASLRRRILAYVWTEGLAVGVAWLGAAFWISLALDWSIEPPVWFRIGMIGLTAIGLLYILYHFILRRVWLPIADHNLAIVLERRFRDFDESLLTTVELTEQPDHASSFHPQMLAAAEHAAIRSMADVRLADVFRRGPLVRSLFAAALAIASIVVYSLLAPRSFGMWESRVLPPFSPDLWPRRVHLSIEGFDNPDHRIVVAKGADLTVVAKADTEFEVPETVQIRYRTEEGRSRDNMSRVGVAGPEESYQAYSFTFRGILSSRTFDIFAGDAALRDYKIDVVDVPTIELVLHCEYPAYTRILSHDLPARSVEVAQGSRITIRATANKDLKQAEIQRLMAESAVPLGTIKLDKSDRRHFSYTILRLDETQTLLFGLSDMDGIHSREPIRLNITARPDEPPRVGVRLRGISSSVTPTARLPLEGDITDDYGIAKLWYAFTEAAEDKFDEAVSVHVPLTTDPRLRTAIHFDRQSNEGLELKDRGVTVGQHLLVAVNAEDNCTLGKTPNVGPGEKFPLTVVSPEQLLSILEARELTLRMRLESIVQDVTISRDRLARLDFAPPAKPAATTQPAGKETKPAVKETKPAAKETKPADKDTKSTGGKPASGPIKPATGLNAAPWSPFAFAGSGGEPGDAPATPKPAAGGAAEPGDEADSGHGLSAAPVVVQQAVANGQQSASETLSLATSFDDIRDELANNRVDTPELESRLKDQIGDPLRQIAEKSFPLLEARLRKLDAVLTDPTAAKARRDEAVQQADQVLVEMRQVLNKMLELESFNQVVEQLRDIIETEKAVHKDTVKKQKEEKLKLND